MNKVTALRDLFEKYSGSIAYVAVVDKNGDEGIGTAFYVGEGVFVTAKHVVEGKVISEVATTKRIEVNTDEGYQYIEPTILEIVEGPLFPDSDEEDVAIFRVSNAHTNMPVIPLGSHDNFSLKDNDFILSNAIVLGYPPVPFTTVPHQIVVNAEVNAVIDVRHSEYPHFIISAMARGGFSGGVAISEYGHALGLVTESLILNEAPAEVGFMSVINTEVIHKCIVKHYRHELVMHGVFYDDDPLIEIQMTKPDKFTKLNTRLYNANIRVFDDGRDVLIEISCGHSVDIAVAFAAFNSIVPLKTIDGQSMSGYIFSIPKYNPTVNELIKASEAARDVFANVDYQLKSVVERPVHGNASHVAPRGLKLPPIK